MVVGDDRYVAEDAREPDPGDYELLPPVVGIEAARGPSTSSTRTCRATSAAHMVQRAGDADGRRSTPRRTG